MVSLELCIISKCIYLGIPSTYISKADFNTLLKFAFASNILVLLINLIFVLQIIVMIKTYSWHLSTKLYYLFVAKPI